MVIDELIVIENGQEKNVDSADNKIIDVIRFNDSNYHFAKRNQVTNGVCENAVNEPIIDMQISGNSIQNGTPTPQTPIEIESVGDKTKNLINYKTFSPYTNGTITLLDNGLEYTGSYYIATDGSHLVSGKQYFMSFDYESADGIKPIWRFSYTDGTYSAQTQNKQSITVPSDKTVKNVLIYGEVNNNIHTTRYYNIILSEGTLSEYEPYGYRIPIKVNSTTTTIYLSEPLRKVGDYADYIDYKNKKVVRNIANKIITSSSITAKSGSSTDTFHYYFIPFADAMVGNKIPIDANIGGGTLQEFGARDKEGIFSNVNTTFFISFFNITTLAEARQFVDDNNVYTNYVLATPTEETIDIPEISTADGTNIFDVETTIKPSELLVDYWKQIGVIENLEEIIQSGDNILIIKTASNITQNGSNLIIGG